MEEDPVVKEAVRRLPQEEQDLRLFRLKRALDLSVKKSLLPREQWTTPEEVSQTHTLQCAGSCSLGLCYAQCGLITSCRCLVQK